MNKPKKPILPVMVDIETLSLRVNAALIDVAFGVMDDSGDGKRWLINPDSYNDTDLHFNYFDINDDTIAFHAKQGSNLVEQAKAVGISWRTAAVEIHEWLSNYGHNYETHIWAQGKDFDICRLDNFFTMAGLKCPWKYTNTHCLRDLSKLYNDTPRAWYGNHTAMKDVIAQAAHLKALAQKHDRIYRFVYGEQ